jgi:hypothetical protein
MGPDSLSAHTIADRMRQALERPDHEPPDHGRPDHERPDDEHKPGEKGY